MNMFLMRSITCLLLFQISLSFAVSPKDSCKAIVFSGGGSKGAYEAGVLWGMINADEDKSKYEYDVVTGISAGAINAAGVSLFKKGNELEMVSKISEFWQNLSDK